MKSTKAANWGKIPFERSKSGFRWKGPERREDRGRQKLQKCIKRGAEGWFFLSKYRLTSQTAHGIIPNCAGVCCAWWKSGWKTPLSIGTSEFKGDDGLLTELKTGPRVVGAKQTRRALSDGKAVRVYLAEDADPGVTGPIETLCAEKGTEVLRVPAMRELGQACGIAVGAAVAALVR